MVYNENMDCGTCVQESCKCYLDYVPSIPALALALLLSRLTTSMQARVIS